MDTVEDNYLKKSIELCYHANSNSCNSLSMHVCLDDRDWSV